MAPKAAQLKEVRRKIYSCRKMVSYYEGNPDEASKWKRIINAHEKAAKKLMPRMKVPASNYAGMRA